MKAALETLVSSCLFILVFFKCVLRNQIEASQKEKIMTDIKENRKSRMEWADISCPPALNLRKIPVIKAAKRDKNNQ